MEAKSFLEYLNKYEESKDIPDNDLWKTTYQFSVSVLSRCGMSGGVDPGGPFPLMCLDEEDLEYLRKKYSKRLDDEMNAEIEKVRLSYQSIKDALK